MISLHRSSGAIIKYGASFPLMPPYRASRFKAVGRGMEEAIQHLRLPNRSPRARSAGQRHGITVGIKDIIDTSDLQTEIRSKLSRVNQPRSRCTSSHGAEAGKHQHHQQDHRPRLSRRTTRPRHGIPARHGFHPPGGCVLGARQQQSPPA